GSAGIAGRHSHDSLHVLEHRFDAPEAAAGKHGHLLATDDGRGVQCCEQREKGGHWAVRMVRPDMTTNAIAATSRPVVRGFLDTTDTPIPIRIVDQMVNSSKLPQSANIFGFAVSGSMKRAGVSDRLNRFVKFVVSINTTCSTPTRLPSTRGM